MSLTIRAMAIMALRQKGHRPMLPQVVLVVKNPPANAGNIRDMGLIPGSERSPGEGHGNPLQYSCLENTYRQRNLVPTGHSLPFYIQKGKREFYKWNTQGQVSSSNAPLRLQRLCCLIFPHKIRLEFLFLSKIEE